jgi:hypothetical protein
MLLLIGFTAAGLALVAQVLLAEWANRSAVPRFSAYAALLLSGAGAAAWAVVPAGTASAPAVRVLAVLFLGVVLTGVLTLLRALSRELALAAE